ncbi:Protein ESMERALDA 1 [Linum perenne]
MSPLDTDIGLLSSLQILSIWKNSYKKGEWKPCVNKSLEGIPASNGYIFVEANGGLNQQRTSICDAVAVAGILNATVLVPTFHYHSIWKDPSKFRDIYDQEFFFTALQNEVRVVDKIPGYLMERFDHNFSHVFNFRVKAWSPIEYYKDVVLPRLLEEKVIRIAPFAHRLSFDAPPAVQRLRCMANYVALRFSKPILTMGEYLVARMKELSASHGGKYVSVHLRFEEDMVAFSCCVFDGDAQEDRDMKAARERGWRGKFTRPGRTLLPGATRLNGKCPLSPLEVGLMLRGMGFSKDTYIYLASGKIYNAEKNMAPLLEMFPNLQTKDTLATAEELAPFKNFSSRMAAIDYTVCLHSEVFVTTQGGNFPHFLLGHRRFLYNGHAKTIRPDKRKLALILDNTSIGPATFKASFSVTLFPSLSQLRLIRTVLHENRKGGAMETGDLSAEMEVDAFRRLFPLRYYERHLAESIRPDGRPLGRARDTTLALGAVASADGSALAKIGSTTMLAAIKMEVMTPSTDSPDEGCIAIEFHMPPICSPIVRPGRPAEAAPVVSKQLSDTILR